MDSKFLKFLEEAKPSDADVDDLDDDGAEDNSKMGKKYSNKKKDEGVREVTFTAKYKDEDGEVHDEKKKMTIQADQIDKKKDEFKVSLYKKYKFEGDIVGQIKVKIGEYDASSKAEDNMSNTDDDGSRGFGSKESKGMSGVAGDGREM